MKNIITYSVKKVSDRSLYISVQNGEVTVNAPWYYTRNKIQAAVEEKRNWILKKMNENRENDFNIRPFKVYGVVYELKVSYKNIEKIECNIEKNSLIVLLPKKYKKLNSDSMMDILIDRIYMKIAERELEGIMEKFRIKLKIAPEDYKVKFLSDKLAIVTDEKKIIIDPRIIKLEKEKVEYIVLHQFCHLKYKTHSKGFWDMVKSCIPNYENINVDGLKF